MKPMMRAGWAGMIFGLLLSTGGGISAEEVAEGAGAAVMPARPAQHELLVRAIRERRLLHFSYGGYPRVVEPHAYGVSTAGEVVLHGYQTAGGSASEPPPGWRTFAVAEMGEIVVAETGFSGPRRSYTGDRPKLDPLWAEIAAADRTKRTE